ncbi:hypothetical protein HYPSUDRAFT_202233 [Hypholoma sublateritium FD-334 SS-4]|uniref:HMG box domain-containing protein n=1 Tax=Hypholoma sublateritium (strain FD-334 SS-4) TaxID=945553 RepID=A0A0D2L693_HYPSF|nr:hypothetical protein HYPSUDRAFT_202233 [Hypholoma sublateritium FD-334 SS-4]
MQSTSKLILPKPTYKLPDPTKKSHARKQPEGHIRRPRNAFILFRCDFVRQKKIPESVETDHRNISRIVGRIWREMTALEKDPWVKMADEEKANHMRNHPGYRFTRGSPGTRKGKRVEEGIRRQNDDRASLSPNEVSLALERAASCPPGALHVPVVNAEGANVYGNPMKIRDDLERRPSRVPVYQSTPHDLEDASESSLFADVVNQQYYAETLKDPHQLATSLLREESAAKESESAFCGPRMSARRYPIPDMNVPPRWERNSYDVDWQSVQDPDGLHDTSIDKEINHLETSPRSLPAFSDPFYILSTLPTLPTLPRHGPLYYPLERGDGHDNPSAPSDRRESTFFSPRSGTWRLPPPSLPITDGLINEILAENGILDISPVPPYFRKSPHSLGSRDSDGVAAEGIQHFSRSSLANESEPGGF